MIGMKEDEANVVPSADSSVNWRYGILFYSQQGSTILRVSYVWFHKQFAKLTLINDINIIHTGYLKTFLVILKLEDREHQWNYHRLWAGCENKVEIN